MLLQDEGVDLMKTHMAISVPDSVQSLMMKGSGHCSVFLCCPDVVLGTFQSHLPHSGHLVGEAAATWIK